MGDKKCPARFAATRWLAEGGDVLVPLEQFEEPLDGLSRRWHPANRVVSRRLFAHRNDPLAKRCLEKLSPCSRAADRDKKSLGSSNAIEHDARPDRAGGDGTADVVVAANGYHDVLRQATTHSDFRSYLADTSATRTHFSEGFAV